MIESPQQSPLVRPTSTGRVNWTQATTMTVAAFIGCLLALVAGFLLYRHLLARKEKPKKVSEYDQALARMKQELIPSESTRQPSPTLVSQGPVASKPGPDKAAEADGESVSTNTTPKAVDASNDDNDTKNDNTDQD